MSGLVKMFDSAWEFILVIAIVGAVVFGIAFVLALIAEAIEAWKRRPRN